MRNIAIRVKNELEYAEAKEYLHKINESVSDPYNYDEGFKYIVLGNDEIYMTSSDYINVSNYDIHELPLQKTFPRLMYVGDHPSDLNANQQNNPNLVLGVFNGLYLALSGYKSIEHIDHDSRTLFFKMAKEVPEEIEVSQEDAIKYIAELKGWEVEQIKIV